MAAAKPNARLNIMEAALREFADRGYDRTTMDTIAARAHVAKGSLYYHFSSKEALFRALFEERGERLAELTEVAVRDLPWDGVMTVWVNFFWQQQDFLELFLTEAWRSHEREQLVQKFLRRIVDPLIPVLAGPDQDGEVLAYALFGAIAVPAMHLVKKGVSDRASLDSLVTTLAAMIKQKV